MVVVRPAFLTDGECVAESESGKGKGKVGKSKMGYKFGTDEELTKHNGYFISRKDVAHFIVEEAIEHWERFEGKAVNVCY